MLSWLEKHGLRGQLSKCQVLAIKQASTPKTVEQLESFLGMINYYGKFIPNLSSIAAPLNKLRHKNKPWKWKHLEETAFQQLKKALISTKVLVHYDPKLPVQLDCDAPHFCKLGLPEQIVTDNRPQFISEEFTVRSF